MLASKHISASIECGGKRSNGDRFDSSLPKGLKLLASWLMGKCFRVRPTAVEHERLSAAPALNIYRTLWPASSGILGGAPGPGAENFFHGVGDRKDAKGAKAEEKGFRRTCVLKPTLFRPLLRLCALCVFAVSGS